MHCQNLSLRFHTSQDSVNTEIRHHLQKPPNAFWAGIDSFKTQTCSIKVDFKSSAAHVKIFPLTTRALAYAQGPLQSGDIPNTCGVSIVSAPNSCQSKCSEEGGKMLWDMEPRVHTGRTCIMHYSNRENTWGETVGHAVNKGW